MYMFYNNKYLIFIVRNFYVLDKSFIDFKKYLFLFNMYECFGYIYAVMFMWIKNMFNVCRIGYKNSF